MIEMTIKGVLYKQLFTKVEWSGGLKGTSRIINVDFPIEEIPNIEVGDDVKFKLDTTKNLFTGKIFKITKKGESKIANFVAYDPSIYLNKNKFIKNYHNKMPSEIVKEICKELNLKVGRLPINTVKCTFPAIDRSGYEIILAAYTIQHNKDKKIYSVVCNDGVIEVVDQGVLLEGVILDSYKNTRSSSYTKDIENMVNQIVVYKTEKEKVQIINKVSNEEDKKKYGLFQNIVEYTRDMNNIFDANSMLKTIQEIGDIVVDGDVDLMSGYSVAINENKSGLMGNFLIATDTHTWTSTGYSTRLTLDFQNLMDIISFEKYEKKKSVKKVTVDSGSEYDAK